MPEMPSIYIQSISNTYVNNIYKHIKSYNIINIAIYYKYLRF